MQYKALMLDLDGTTIPNKKDGLPTPKVTEAIFKASTYVHVCIVTGRIFYHAVPILNHLKLSGPNIISGGAQVINASTLEVLWERRIPKADVAQICHLLQEFHIPFLIQQEREREIPFSSSYQPKSTLNLAIPDLSDTLADQIIDTLSHIPTIGLHKIVGWKQGTVWIAITHAEATKQHGIHEVAKILGISTQEIIGVGDGYNDVPLLMACGLKVAMGNAVDELKAIADVIAPSVTDDGVAAIIHKYILQPE